MRSPRPSRHSRLARLAPLAVAASLLVAACGDDQEEGSNATTATTDTTDTSVADGAASTGATGTTDSSDSSDSSDSPDSTDAPEPTLPADVPAKPEVEVPAGEVTELTITDLTEGEGPEAAEGDTVVVHYVGVRSEDGTEFDNSYDRGEPFTVTLGAGMVIPGWDQGLVGVKQGGQRQLDIPTDLAYGDSPQGDVIQPGDALTFVVDVVAVIAKSDPADAPTVEVEPGTTVDSLEIEDLEAGEGDEVQPGQSIVFDYIFIRTDTGEQLESSWESGSPQNLPYDESLIQSTLYDAFDGVQVGTLRKVTIPFVDASEIFQLPGDTDIVLVLRVNAIY